MRRRQRRMKANPSGPFGLALQGASAALRGLGVESTTPGAARLASAPCRANAAHVEYSDRLLVQPLLLEYQGVLFELGDHPIPRDEIAAQNLLRQRVLDLRLNGALQGPRTVYRVEARLADLVACVIVQAQSGIALRQFRPQPAQL